MNDYHIQIGVDAVEKLENFITVNRLDANTRIPSEKVLCEMWGINRATLRIAIRIEIKVFGKAFCLPVVRMAQKSPKRKGGSEQKNKENQRIRNQTAKDLYNLFTLIVHCANEARFLY